METIKRILVFGGFGIAVLLTLGGWIVEKTSGRTVLPIVMHDAATIELNKAIHSAGEPVAPIYGQPASAPIVVLFVPAAKIVIPAEDPSLQLLPTTPDEKPLQLKTFRFMARYAGAAFALAGIVGLVLPRRKKQG